MCINILTIHYTYFGQSSNMGYHIITIMELGQWYSQYVCCHYCHCWGHRYDNCCELGKIWFVAQQMLVFLIVMVVFQLLQTMDFLLYWFFSVLHYYFYVEFILLWLLILNKFVHRYLVGMRNSCINYKDCVPISISLYLGMKVFGQDWAFPSCHGNVSTSSCSLGVVDVVDCTSMSLVMDYIPSIVVCATSINVS